MSNEERTVKAGPLKVRIEQYGETRLVQLNGELDLSNVSAVERELSLALDDGAGQVILDMGELDFIDSTGIALLVRATAASDGDGRLRFLPSRALAVTRVLELTGVADLLPLADGQLSR